MRRTRFIILAATGLAALSTLHYLRSDRHTEETSPAQSTDLKVERFCATCHRLPPANAFPQAVWPRKIQQMYQQFADDKRWPKDAIPSIQDSLRYYLSRAPRQLNVTASPQSRLDHFTFTRIPVRPEYDHPHPATANVQWTRLTDGEMRVLLCDVALGYVHTWSPSNGSQQVLGKLNNPSRATVVDFDRDGRLDILVADLGVQTVQETDQGKVVLLRQNDEGGFDSLVLWEKLGRVADVQAADFDGDGDLDLVVGVFGLHATGMLLFLENVGSPATPPFEFEPTILDGRPGFVHTPVMDIDNDDQPDILTLVAQEHEQVEAHLNRGRNDFVRRTVYSAPHPAWGSNGIQIVDFDGNGKLDVLITNGDTLDPPPMLKPYHSIGWLSNQGSEAFTYRPIANFPGVHCAKAGDLDGDGDLDIVACAFAAWIRPGMPEARFADALILLEQTQSGSFTRHVLERGTLNHPSLDLEDYDGDGDLDIVVASFSFQASESEPIAPSAVIWRNDR